MSGSMLSLLSGSDDAFCNRNFYAHNQRFTLENSYKDYKNQSNYERQNLEQSIVSGFPDAFAAFSRGLNLPSIGMEVKSEQNNLNRPVKKSNCETLVRLPRNLIKNSGTLNRDPSTSPKIVGVEKKKNIKYQPVYMQRHSIAFGDGYSAITDVNTGNNLRTQSKRLSIEEHSQSHVKNQETIATNSVKDRISFFNRLATASSHQTELSDSNHLKPKDTFLSLLRQKEPTNSKASVIRLSQLIDKVSAVKTTALKALSNESTIAVKPSIELGAPKSCSHIFKYGAHSLPTQLKRKPSFEKTRIVASSISRGSISYGTNPKRHSLMEDLSLVVPVKLRIAEIEKKILMTNM